MIIAMAACLLAVRTAKAQIDLVPGINYSYNPPGSNCIITSITVDACNNDAGNASAFDVSMYLYDQSTTNYWIIGTTRLNNGLSGNSCITISNWDIDITQTTAVPNGTYRLGIWVDSGSEISETDENNNAGLLSGNINYTCAGSSGVNDVVSFISDLSSYPNPVSTTTTITYSLLQDAKVVVDLVDLTGKKIASLDDSKKISGTYNLVYDASALETGVYFLRVSVNGVAETRMISVIK